MRQRDRYLPSLMIALAGISVFLLSFLIDWRMPVSSELARILSIAWVVIGMLLVAWAVVFLRDAFLGTVEPRSEGLVTHGPYRHIRHPVYLGMTIALTGVAVGFRSWAGLAAVFVLFLPGEIYRARLEEKALDGKFGARWGEYAAGTGFFLPKFGNRSSDSG